MKGVLTLGVGSLFGDLSILVNKKWRHTTVFALEKSQVIVFSNNQISRLVKVIIKT